MNKKNAFLLTVFVLLAGTAVYLITDSFERESIQIACAIRPQPATRRPQRTTRNPSSGKPGYTVTFAFNHKFPLTSVKVFSLADALTNKYPQPIWEMLSDSNSIPTKTVVYGSWIYGMHPPFKEAFAQPLEPGASYRLVIKTPKLKGEKDFQVPR